MTYRNTKAIIYLNNIEKNVKKIINKYNEYKYYIGVVKADSYGHNSKETVESIIRGGCNYLAVSSLDEALEIRKNFNVPILCLGLINEKYIDICEKNNIDITVDNLEYIKKIKNYNVKVHIKIDTGMNRLGIKNKEDFNSIYSEIRNSKLTIHGIYTHIYEAHNEKNTNKQIELFRNITSSIDLNEIPIVHIAQSDTLINYKKIDFCNGCRLGIIMYGLTNNDLGLEKTISLCSEVIEIKELQKDECVSYDGLYVAKANEKIAIVCIGYADGINRKLSGSYVYINDKKYKIVGNICMDMLMVSIDDNVNIGDRVYIYKDIEHLEYMSKFIDTIPYELICNISKRVPREYIK